MTGLRPPSARPEFDGVAAFYDSDLAPWLAEKEASRRAAVFNFLVLAGAPALLAAAVALRGPFGETNLQVAAFIAAGAAGLALWLLGRTRDEITHGLLDRVSRRLNFAYRGRPGRPECYDRFKSLKLLPDHNIERWEDEVRGAYGGAEFTLVEAHLKFKTSGKKSSVRTVFHGQLLVLGYPRRFLGKTVVARDRGLLNRFWKPGPEFARVGLASAAFEKAFEAWSTDQVEAREILDPVVLERFQELERLCRGKSLRAAFCEGSLILAIETGDRLNIGSMFVPLADPRRVEAILKEFDVIFDLIDVLIKRADRPLAGALTLAGLKDSA